MNTNPHELTNKLLQDLGIEKPSPELAEKVEEHFAKVILEVLIRRFPEGKLDELKQKFEADAPDLEDFVDREAATIPGLAQELEEAVLREREVIRHLLYR